MKTLRGIRALAVGLACIGVVFPIRRVAAVEPDGRTSAQSLAPWNASLRDIALGRGGRLSGTVVDASGRPLSRQIVLTSQEGQVVRRGASSSDGRFFLDGLRGGVYQLSTIEGSLACRLWTADAAPPAAADQLFVVSDSMVQRGQRPIGELLTSPSVLIGALIIAAIVIPIAVHNAQDDAS